VAGERFGGPKKIKNERAGKDIIPDVEVGKLGKGATEGDVGGGRCPCYGLDVRKSI